MQPTTIQLISTTAPVLRRSAANLTTRLCELYFEENPDQRAKSGGSRRRVGLQAQAVTHAVMAFAMQLRTNERCDDVLRHVADKHGPLDTTAAEYEQLGQCLRRAIGEVLGVSAAADIIHAWGEAYESLAPVLVQHVAHPAEPQPEQEPQTTPWGEVLRESARPLLVVSTSVGASQALGMLNVALASQREVFFMHVSQGPMPQDLRREIMAVAMRQEPPRLALIEQPPTEPGTPHLMGLVDRTLLSRQTIGDPSDMEVYFVGPSEFMATVFRHFSTLGRSLELLGGHDRSRTQRGSRASELMPS